MSIVWLYVGLLLLLIAFAVVGIIAAFPDRFRDEPTVDLREPQLRVPPYIADIAIPRVVPPKPEPTAQPDVTP